MDAEIVTFPTLVEDPMIKFDAAAEVMAWVTLIVTVAVLPVSKRSLLPLR